MRCRKSNASHMTFIMWCPRLPLGRSSLQSRYDRFAHKGCTPKGLSTASRYAFRRAYGGEQSDFDAKREDEVRPSKYAPTQVSLAELKQEVYAAKSLSTSASAVLQTNASLLNLQHRIVAPSARCPSATAAKAVLRPGEPQDCLTVDAEARTKAGAGQTAALPLPQTIQWLATGVRHTSSFYKTESRPLHCIVASLRRCVHLTYILTACRACLRRCPCIASSPHCFMQE